MAWRRTLARLATLSASCVCDAGRFYNRTRKALVWCPSVRPSVCLCRFSRDLKNPRVGKPARCYMVLSELCGGGVISVA